MLHADVLYESEVTQPIALKWSRLVPLVRPALAICGTAVDVE